MGRVSASEGSFEYQKKTFLVSSSFLFLSPLLLFNPFSSAPLLLLPQQGGILYL